MKSFSVVCFYLCNTLSLVCGLLMLIAGLLMRYLPTLESVFLATAPSVSQSQTGLLSIGLIMVGAFVAFISFVGFCGVISETKCMLNLYLGMMVILLIGTIAIGAAAIIYGQKPFVEDVDKYFRVYVNQYNSSINSKSQGVVDSVQHFFDCCGVDGPTDYPNATLPDGYNNNTAYLASEIPKSCCKGNTVKELEPCLNATMPISERKEYYYQEGCATKVETYIHENTIILAGVCFGFAFLMLLTIIFVCVYKRDNID